MTELTDESFIGIDVGGTTIKTGWIQQDGTRLAESSLPTSPQASPSIAIRDVIDSISKWIASKSNPVRAIGLGTPGPLDLDAGMILTPSNLPGWWNYPIRQELSAATGLPVTFANDANAAAFGEHWQGAGRGFSGLVLLTLGTGVGGGIVVNGQLIVGGTGHAAECGHSTVDYDVAARICPCGMRGHLEAYASATAVSKIATELAAQQDGNGQVLARTLAETGALTAFDVYRAASVGDNKALLIIDGVADSLARGITNLAFTIDPEIVLLGGAMDFGGKVDPVGQRFLQRIRQGVRQNVFSQIAENLKIEFAELGGSAGWIGAAGLAKRDYFLNSANGSAPKQSLSVVNE